MKTTKIRGKKAKIDLKGINTGHIDRIIMELMPILEEPSTIYINKNESKTEAQTRVISNELIFRLMNLNGSTLNLVSRRALCNEVSERLKIYKMKKLVGEI